MTTRTERKAKLVGYQAKARARRTTETLVAQQRSQARMHGSQLLLLQQEHARELTAARNARDCIRITVDALMDSRERDVTLRARYERMSSPSGYPLHEYEPLYSAIKIDYAEASYTERAAWMEHASRRIAEHGLQQIIQKWRSR